MARFLFPRAKYVAEVVERPTNVIPLLKIAKLVSAS
jgi:hypothetical protein